MSYSLGTISFPLASVDGSLAKTDKSALLHLLEDQSEECIVSSVPSGSALIVDGMAVIQATTPIPHSFGELADKILVNLMSLARKYGSTRIDFVADTYPDISIKNAERGRRAAVGSQIIQLYGKEQKIPKQWKKFLADGKNKEALLSFLFECWRNASYSSATMNFRLYMAHARSCQEVVVDSGNSTTNDVPELHCDHEEADTRLVFHAKHAAEAGHLNIIIKSPDTDVVIIALSHLQSIDASIYFLTGMQNKVRILHLQEIAGTLSPEKCRALVGLHTFTGCDSVSAFYGKGKKKAFSVAMEEKSFVETFCSLGEHFDMSANLLDRLQRFVCKLYGVDLSSVNEARYNIFCVSPKSLEHSLPPTKDALEQHSLRANYQAAIYRRALSQWISAPTPAGRGWTVSDKEISLCWMTKDPAPKDALQLIHCGCKSGQCSTNRCSCKSSKLPCTELCRCSNCSSQPDNRTDDIHSDSDNDLSDIE